MVEPENMVLVLLREMRSDMNERFDEMDRRLADMQKRLDAMHLNGMKALKGFIGHRAMAERAMASFEVDMVDLKRRIAELEPASA